MKKSVLLIFASALALSACNSHGSAPGQEQDEPGTELGIVPASMDKSLKPGDDGRARRLIHHLPAGHSADPGDHPCARHFPVVEVAGGELADFEER